jgi:transmembrane sensor
MTSNDLQNAAHFIQNHLAVDDTPGELDHLRFTETLNRHSVRKRRRRVLGISSAFGFVAILGVASTQTFNPQVLTYEVGHSGQKETIGSYVSAPLEKPLSIHFSEGSDIVLAPRARGRVAQTTAKGATVVLEDGRARADIVHKEHTQWQILAGPYMIGVTGTSFDVAFNVATQTFELDMHSGSVRVSGPGLKTPIEIRDQQRLTLSNTNRTVNEQGTESLRVLRESKPVEEPAPMPAIASVCANPVQATPNIDLTKTRESSSASARKNGDDPQESFAHLGAKGLHAKIIELAEQSGVDSVTASISSKDLIALGNAARFSGKTGIATKAYSAVRQRFGGSADATSAAFFLGRLAEASNPAAAMNWYDKYQTESPNGVWIADALGRNLVLSNQLRGRDATLGAAKEYLERFPTGPYAGFARKLLSL